MQPGVVCGERPQSLLPIKHEVSLVGLFHKHDSRDGEPKEQRFYKSVHLRLAPNEPPLKPGRLQRWIAMPEGRNYYVSPFQPADKSFNIEVCALVDDRRRSRLCFGKLLLLLRGEVKILVLCGYRYRVVCAHDW